VPFSRMSFRMTLSDLIQCQFNSCQCSMLVCLNGQTCIGCQRQSVLHLLFVLNHIWKTKQDRPHRSSSRCPTLADSLLSNKINVLRLGWPPVWLGIRPQYQCVMDTQTHCLRVAERDKDPSYIYGNKYASIFASLLMFKH